MVLISDIPLENIPSPPEVLNDKVFLVNDAGRLTLNVLDSAQNNGVFSNHLRSYRSRLMKSVEGLKIQYLDVEKYNQAKKETAQELFDDVDTEKIAIDLLRDAVTGNASDIHIRVYTATHAEIKFRQQGDMKFYQTLESDEADKLCNALFSSIGEHQSETTFSGYNRMRARITNQNIMPRELASIRIESGPIAGGYHMVMRLLYNRTHEATGTLEERLTSLGYHSKHSQDITKSLAKPSGIVIIAGPTGSGKSTTLKAVLEAKHEEYPTLNFMTVEDPPEYLIKGAVQIRAGVLEGEKRGDDANFADAIKHAMRSDPDVIMVGEIRDGESGMAAIRAAMTGHLVVTTIHANRVFSILARLRDLISGVTDCPDTYLSDGSIISGLVYQTLIKTLCPQCSLTFEQAKDTITPGLVKRLENAGYTLPAPEMRFHNPKSPAKCPICEGTGYAGRQVLSETCLVDHAFLLSFNGGGTAGAEEEWRNRNPLDIETHAKIKIRLGFVDPRDAEAKIGPLREGGQI